MTDEHGHSFSYLNGREVLDSGERKIWRCPVCAWWREWVEDRCCGCGMARDIAAGHVHRSAKPKVRGATAA